MHIYLQIMKDIFWYEFWADMVFNKIFFRRSLKIWPRENNLSPPPTPPFFHGDGQLTVIFHNGRGALG